MKASAFTADATVMPPVATEAKGLWNVLAHVTDGTDPSTTIVTELPRITPEIRALAGQTITIDGYAQPASVGYGKAEYIVGRLPYHCAFCYKPGRGSLALVKSKQPLKLPSDTTKMVRLQGTLQLQETIPDEFYFQLLDAKLV